MRSRMLLKTFEVGHDYSSPRSSHCWHEVQRTSKHIIYECCKCPRRRRRKLPGQRQAFRIRKIRRIMERALA